MASRTSIEEATQRITKFFTIASAQIVKTISTALTAKKVPNDEVILKEVNAILNGIEVNAFPIIEADIRWHYTSSALEVTNTMKKAGLTAVGKISEQEALELNAIISKTLNDYGEALKGAFSSAQKVITDARKTRFEQIFIEGKLQEQSLKQIKDKIVADLQKDFIAITDKGGRTWKLDTYAEMLTRTRIREVTNTGLTMRMQIEGYDLVQVSSHAGACDMCVKWNGIVLSITGKTPNYPTVFDAESDGLMHPNCKHRYLPYHLEFENVAVARQSLSAI
jgi:hypothetical protein